MPAAAREIDNLCGFPTLLKAKPFPLPLHPQHNDDDVEDDDCDVLMMMGMTAMIDQIYQFLKHKHIHLSYFHIVSSHILPRSLYHTIMMV